MLSELELQELPLKLTNIRLHRVGEDTREIVKRFCLSNGFYLELSTINGPESNGAAKRLIQEDWTRYKVLLFDANLPKQLWPESMKHANCIRNGVPSSKLNRQLSILKWNKNSRISYYSLLEFGAPGFACVYYNDKTKSKKFPLRPISGYFIGKESDTTLINIFAKDTLILVGYTGCLETTGLIFTTYNESSRGQEISYRDYPIRAF